MAMLISTTTDSRSKKADGTYMPILPSIPRYAAAGFDAVDICFFHAIDLDIFKDGIEINAPNWETWTGELREALQKNGLSANQSHAPFYNVLDPSIPDRDFREEMVRRSIIASGKLGVKWVVMHAGTVPGAASSKVSLKQNTEYFKRHLELAEKHGTGIAVENLFDYSSDENHRAKRRYAGGPDEVLELTGKLSESFSNTGVCWDFGHGNEMGLDQGDALRLLGKNLKAVHVNDNNGVLDDHILPFTGNIDWPAIMKVLKEIEYTGDFTYEIHRFTQTMPDEVFVDALRLSLKIAKHLVGLME